MDIKQSLLKIQQTLKSPKNQYNSYGGYNYRNCEDILEAVKPLCNENNCVLIIHDEIVLIGERYYVKATATLTSVEESASISSTAYAREAETKKGMDASQITGSASSYSRKYALNGLFCIDDTRDADTQDNTNLQSDNKKTITDKQLKRLYAIAKSKGHTNEEVKAVCERLHKKEPKALNGVEYNAICTRLEGGKHD